MGNFSPTEKMKRDGVSRHSHLLWSVENYLIRTQTAYDRLLIVIDRLFHIQNSPQFISHQSTVINSHINRTNIPQLLKHVKKIFRKYYFDRNKIIHQQSYLENELYAIEAYTILTVMEEKKPGEFDDLKENLKMNIRTYIGKKKRELTRTNKNFIASLDPLFSAAHEIFKRQQKRL